ncbi:D-alanyl-D-alanine carboxypeptidase (penicillin-binding protein 5/6) [Ruminococcus sp. YE71]|uniref:D-alanyl-D-alanine carboxypeptidase family protein n=1 Tax=unclassified Ruminococcus TaxID=2608920 RepID=UPI00088806A1|nr:MULTISPECIES: serine hydrolase [unclassified Ruminococcus]SDA14426.1 D-alanyl-D-alanine carboxypeptidase (penicillin-binding protein 5/6) [Ruminococcus sp. YE78]SFW21014.1 D-alanyl-D-alanine carboxypeptidase (penicillin-binding protein 5/6) [Ruminococcus sp. YE71]
MRKRMTRIAANHTGNAALCAILIMIMLLAVGTAVLVVTGRKGIEENQNMPQHTYSFEEAESSSVAEPVQEEVKPKMEYPEKDFDFMKMQLESVSAKYSVLLDCDNNKIYTGKSYTKKAYPASLTKIMTIIVALENCDNLNDTYKFTKADIKTLADENASVAGFVAGEKVTVRDLLYGAILPSGADATLGLANYVAGSEAAFVEMMNAKVEELGLTGTHFTNASGLHNENHYSTALDMAMIVKYAIDNPAISQDFLNVMSAKEYTTKSSNKNEDGIKLTSIFHERYDGFFIDRDADGKSDVYVVGGKTGFTDESQYSLASIYQLEEGSYFVCITMKSPTAGDATMDNVSITERYMPTYDLIGGDLSSGSSSSVDSNQDSSAVDQTASKDDQTDSSSKTDDPNVVIPVVTQPGTSSDSDLSTGMMRILSIFGM